MDPRKTVFQQTAVVAIGEGICIAVMFGVFALLGRLDGKVLLGGLLGGLLAIANFFAMAVGVSLAADKAEQQNVKGGKALLQSSFLLRYGLLFLLLFVGAKSGVCNLVALLLPLVFVRPVLTFGEFFRKKGEDNP